MFLTLRNKAHWHSMLLRDVHSERSLAEAYNTKFSIPFPVIPGYCGCAMSSGMVRHLILKPSALNGKCSCALFKLTLDLLVS